ncbi:MAG: TetR family transcriptional regulator [Psychromonas sp.]
MTQKKQGRRTAQDSEKTKHKIMMVATDLFCERGYEKVSLRNISDEAGVSHSLIRYHFGSKDKVWYAISDDLHEHMENYINTIAKKFPKTAKANEKLYFFVVHILAHMLIYKRPIQFMADAVRQEKELFYYFINRSGELHNIIFSLADNYNASHIEKPVNIQEVKWQMLMFAHGAASLSPFIEETWGSETVHYDECLLSHWKMFNRMMVSLFQIPADFVIKPNSIKELIYDVPSKYSW